MGEEITTVPLMSTIKRGITVQRPVAEMGRPEIGPFGAVSVGPGHIPGLGGAIHIAFHERDGTTVVATFNPDGLRELVLFLNAAVERVMAGDFDQAERAN